MLPSGEDRRLFHSLSYELRVPHRKSLHELYDESSINLRGTQYLLLAYAELNDPRQVVPLTEVLSRFPVTEVNRYIAFGNRCFECEGLRSRSPYCDLFFRSWIKAVELFNSLLHYERQVCLEKIQRELQQLSRAFDEALRGLLGRGLTWHVDLLQPNAKESSNSLLLDAEAFCGANTLPLFAMPNSLYTTSAVYALLSLLVLEVRFQEMEKRVQDFLDLDAKDERIVSLGPEIEEMRNAIQKEPSTLLVLHKFNPMRHHVSGFDHLITQRYDTQEQTSHLSILGFLALTKNSIVLSVEPEMVVEMARSMVQASTCVLSNQTALEFVYKTGHVHQPVPMVRRERQQISSDIDTSRTSRAGLGIDDEGFPSVTTMNELRVTCLRTVGCNVDWSKIKLEPFPDDWIPSDVVQLDGYDVDESSGEAAQHWPFAKTLSRFCCRLY